MPFHISLYACVLWSRAYAECLREHRLVSKL